MLGLGKVCNVDRSSFAPAGIYPSAYAYPHVYSIANIYSHAIPCFQSEYAGLDTCNGSWWVEIKLKNKGSVPLKSVNISVKDNVTGVVVVNLADGFTNLDGCLVKNHKGYAWSG